MDMVAYPEVFIIIELLQSRVDPSVISTKYGHVVRHWEAVFMQSLNQNKVSKAPIL